MAWEAQAVRAEGLDGLAGRYLALRYDPETGRRERLLVTATERREYG